MKPWKSPTSSRTCRRPAALQWGHGDEAVEEASCELRVASKSNCFNGATAMKPWKSENLAEHKRVLDRLQWGHGDEAVEEISIAVRTVRRHHASMGPRR